MKIYSGIYNVEAPQWKSGEAWEAYEKRQTAYVEQVMAYCRQHGKGPNAGKEVRFGVADGYARYIVLENTKLVHLAIGDSWDAPYVERLTAKDIAQKIQSQEKVAALFGGKRQL